MKILIKIQDEYVKLTISEAKKLYEELDEIFGKRELTWDKLNEEWYKLARPLEQYVPTYPPHIIPCYPTPSDTPWNDPNKVTITS